MFDIAEKSYSHFSRGPQNQPHLIISLLISHYQSDGIISTLQYSETLLQIIVIFVVIILIRTVTEIVN